MLLVAHQGLTRMPLQTRETRMQGLADLPNRAGAATSRPTHVGVVLEVGEPDRRVGTQSEGERAMPDHSLGLRWTGTQLK